jgi:hypothetical protein
MDAAANGLPSQRGSTGLSNATGSCLNLTVRAARPIRWLAPRRIGDSADAAKAFFSDEMRERVAGLYGVEPTIDFVEIAQLVDNSDASDQG